MNSVQTQTLSIKGDNDAGYILIFVMEIYVLLL